MRQGQRQAGAKPAPARAALQRERSLLYVAASRARLADLAARMHDALAPFGENAAPLAELGRRAIERDH